MEHRIAPVGSARAGRSDMRLGRMVADERVRNAASTARKSGVAPKGAQARPLWAIDASDSTGASKRSSANVLALRREGRFRMNGRRANAGSAQRLEADEQH